MKKLRENMDKFFDQLDEHWQALPTRRQHRYTLYFFAGYLLLTAVVIFKMWYDTGKPKNDMVIEHIENPTLKNNKSPATLQDTISTTFKNRNYERK